MIRPMSIIHVFASLLPYVHQDVSSMRMSVTTMRPALTVSDIFIIIVSNSSDSFTNSVTTNLRIFSTKNNVVVYINSTAYKNK